MSTKHEKIIAFDLYNTIVDTSSISKQLSKYMDRSDADTVATSWFKNQTQYQWRLNSMDQFKPFADVTLGALQHALGESSQSLSTQQIDETLKAFTNLSTFPDVSAGLDALASEQSVRAVVFSNGSQSIVRANVYESDDLKAQSSVFHDVIVVEEAKRYKPHPDVYRLLATRVGIDASDAAALKRLWLVSGNPFDIVGARAFGLNACWVDRAGKGWLDRLADEGGGPTVVVKSFADVPRVIAASG